MNAKSGSWLVSPLAILVFALVASLYLADYGRDYSNAPGSKEGAAPAYATQESRTDAMATYAAMLGRATACGADTEDAYRQVGAWMNQEFPQGDKANRGYMRIFLDGVVHHAKEQQAGNSPDSCSSVLRAMDGFPWPNSNRTHEPVCHDLSKCGSDAPPLQRHYSPGSSDYSSHGAKMGSAQ